MTISGPEIEQALADCEVGEEVTLTLTGTRTEGGIEVSSVKKSYPEPEEEKMEHEGEGGGESMPKGVAIIIGHKR